jgi:hypothetical protein
MSAFDSAPSDSAPFDGARLPVADRAAMTGAIKRLVAADRRSFAAVLALYVAAAGAGAALPVMLGSVIDGIGTG